MRNWGRKTIIFILLLSLIYLSNNATTLGEFSQVRNIPSGGEMFYPTKILRATTSHSFQNIELEEIAENFDLFYCFPQYFGPKIRELKALNPDLLALVYRNFRSIYETRIDEYQLALGNDWILTDSSGNIVRSAKWSQNVMVDIGNPDYQDFVVDWIKEEIDQYGFDGVFLDNGLAVRKLEMWFDLTAEPVNPRTGQEWTHEEIKQSCIQVHNKLREAIGSKLDVPNGIYQGHRFWERYDDYVGLIENITIDGFMSEGMWFTYNRVWFTTQEWLESLDFLVWVQDNFLTSDRVFWMKCDVSSKTLPQDCTDNQMIDYAFASSLLGAGGKNNYLKFFSAYSDEEFFLNDYIQNLHNITIGEPLNDFYQIAGTHIYSRDFTDVKVLVNPSESSYTTNLGKNFKTLEGEEISVITLNSHTGIVLKVE